MWFVFWTVLIVLSAVSWIWLGVESYKLKKSTERTLENAEKLNQRMIRTQGFLEKWGTDLGIKS